MLTRRWSHGNKLVWIMLNPSTADAELDDPTIRRVVGFTKDWGFAAAEVVNLFALRATHPVELLHHPDPLGPENPHYVRKAIRESTEFVMLAWGAFLSNGEMPRMNVERWAADAHKNVRCLGVTMTGHPKHPLYIPKTAKPVPVP